MELNKKELDAGGLIDFEGPNDLIHIYSREAYGRRLYIINFNAVCVGTYYAFKAFKKNVIRFIDTYDLSLVVTEEDGEVPVPVINSKSL